MILSQIWVGFWSNGLKVAKRRPYQSPGRSQGELGEPWRNPGLRSPHHLCFVSPDSSPKGTALVPGVTFVQLHVMKATKLAKLVLKRQSLMVMLLIPDVLLYVLRQ